MGIMGGDVSHELVVGLGKDAGLVFGGDAQGLGVLGKAFLADSVGLIWRGREHRADGVVAGVETAMADHADADEGNGG